MTRKAFDHPADGDQEPGIGGARPVRQRPAKKTKSASRSRKNHRKATNVPGGIHQRANKRMSW
jgi:hypothetical protein